MSPREAPFWMSTISEMASIYAYLVVFLVSMMSTWYCFKQAMKEEEKGWIDYGVTEPALPDDYFAGPDFRTQFSNLLTEHGDTVGYRGDNNQLVLLTNNFQLIRHVLIKDFSNFVDRGQGLVTSSPFGKSLFFTTGSDWRRQRRLVSPAFSTGKLRSICKEVDISAQALTKYLQTVGKDGAAVPVKEACSRYACEVIAKTAFGIEADFIAQEDSQFYHYANNILAVRNPRKGVSRYIIRMVRRIPYFLPLCVKFLKLQFLDPVNVEATKYFGTVLKATMEEKKRQAKSTSKSQLDILDLLLRANEAASRGQLEREEGDNIVPGTGTGPVKELTEEEILGHSMLIIFGGMETTSTTLTMCLYSLACHQDIQEKVYQEIQNVVQSQTPTSEELARLSYVDQVINETLRMYQTTPIVDRVARKTRTYNDITIPQGARVVIPYYHILRDPTIYPDPHIFNPDRFSPEEKAKRDPLAFVSFGHGPRICLGMRLAYLELRIALVRILRKLRVVVNDQTEPKKGETIEFTPFNLLTPVKPIKLTFELRNQ